MPENTIDTVWLTPEAHEKLIGELEHLKGEGRTKVSAKIARAREEGDLSENGGYHAAREEQGQMEARIRQLEAMLRDAHVSAPDESSDVVHPGMLVTVAFDGDLDDTDTFLLGSREVMGLDASVDVSVYSPQSPLGQAVAGQSKGAEVSYVAPNGRTINLTVLDFAPHKG
ncbi:MAG TPA: transcription elongation factor GreA [Propionibacteriaceae bacterium]|nr:transcription elongation factor GreA [Propionibacteriaceae bacterium]